METIFLFWHSETASSSVSDFGSSIATFWAVLGIIVEAVGEVGVVATAVDDGLARTWKVLELARVVPASRGRADINSFIIGVKVGLLTRIRVSTLKWKSMEPVE